MLVCTVCLSLLSGCGSTKPMIKNGQPGSLSLSSDLAMLFRGGKKKQSPPSEKAATPAASSLPDLPIDESGPRVRRFIREYAYEQRQTMRNYLASAERHLPLIKTVAKENGVPAEVAYLVMLESGGNPEARSPANALGMWQFMPATARNYGLRVDSWVDERLDPEKSSKAAMLYLKDLYGMFGCWRLALSAYNSGENKLNKVLCREDATEYDEICSSRGLKRETKEFWPRFQAIAQIARNPEKYGFPSREEKRYERNHALAPVEGCHSLQKIAGLIGVSASELTRLNPALVRGMTPPGGDSYPLRVPLEKKELLARCLADVPSEEQRSHIVHVVSRGDSVAKILNRYQVDRAHLTGSNPDVNFRRRLRTGEKIIIPVMRKELPKAHPASSSRLSQVQDAPPRRGQVR
ncbi:MAG: transglycosylase SLT domain-containing protein [Desulfomonile sp.]|nr:transglycosylase SLT domain-containing protein [Desulfomonile sp.]